MSTFIYEHEALLLWLTLISVIGLITSAVLILKLLVHIPSDYFLHKEKQEHSIDHCCPIVRLLYLFIKNILGILFIIGGVIMLFTPGQGILTILLGIVLTDFPYKYKIEQWIITRPPLIAAINKIRAKAGKAPLET
ncbi:PGPGW domain-containing protein [Sulfurovum riftiae]|uniref:Transmembrane protein (PGPGW) n=1 Tax=Sulfurovum riftiae TaxID=1630136 RepID=A0A151CJV6_9BACT|nr:PGPGW domain-containing protein [Sulfurovum riftiae]KYJ87714.1 hypothetical protein AS592_11530 [Sulfurovum riftiae]